MRIAFISTMIGVPWGGSEELWAAAAVAARADGIDVDACVYRYRPRSARLADLEAVGVHVAERPLRPTVIANQADRIAAPFRAVSRRGPDVICLSQGFAYDFVVRQRPGEIKRLTANDRVPYVIVCQYNSDEIILPPGQLAVARELFSGAGAVAFVSEHNRRLAERQLTMPLPRGGVVRNPVNLRDTRAVPVTPGGPTLRLATVARLTAGTKGLDVLLRALAADAWRERDWRLRLYGQGPDEPYLRDLAGFFGIAGRVSFEGQVSDMRAVWADNDVLLLASRGEGTPLALVEAMLCGRPAVVTDVGGNAEWISDGENGFVADAPTAKCFAAALERMWARRSELPALGAAARQTALRLYDPDPGRTLLELIRTAAARPGGGA